MADFHFLRPLWLLLIPLILWACWFFKQRQQLGDWRTVIDPLLLKAMLEKQATSKQPPWALLIAIAAVAATIAIAGPSWQKLPQPVERKQDALIIALDLTLSMYAEDVKPNRLTQAQYAVRDILKQRKEGLTALVAYSADAHTVSPLTDDTATIAAMVPALSPVIMPAYGNQPLSALKLSEQLLQGAGYTSGHIILLTDGVYSGDLKSINNWLAQRHLTLSVLSIGTQGAPIPLPDGGFLRDNKGAVAIAKVDQQRLKELASLGGGSFQKRGYDGQDIVKLLASDNKPQENSQQSLRQFDQYQDNGYWLIFIIIPIALLTFRRGWLLQLFLPLVGLLLISQPQPVMANSWDSLWQTADQQGQQALQNGDAEKAATLFEDPQWKGVAHYQNGDYAAAEESFSQPKNSNDYYNYGNALAQQQKLDQAGEAYKQALTLNPDNQLAAQAQAIIEQAKQEQQQGEGEKGENSEQQPSEQQQDGDQQNQGASDSRGGDDSNNPSPNSPSENSQQPGEDSQPGNNRQSLDDDDSHLQQQQQSEQNEQPSQQSAATDPQPGENADGEQQSQSVSEAVDDKASTDAPSEQASDANNQQLPPQDAATQQWLRQIPDEPSGLLRRKFEYQYQQNRRQQPADDELRW
ncbi:hypothetical protein SIN8267_02869 [Sinobacterium norvegicum]|uniref:VWFA domain-containing protein n=1 Tax=Sinobacterium norvegicum TaxID=1641715 RepID=A0ABN8EJY1_9GAMM|nr:VWA domain-containing protein [Sinobacterium norvegicum]CAH0992733.1 hypothetical protein SIN8267_02869 [Sinobacterium norvegicum]